MSRLTWKAWLGFNAFLALALFLSVGIDRASVALVAGTTLLTAIPLYFDTRDPNNEATRIERVAAGAWLWVRRLLGFGAAALALATAGLAAVTVEATLENCAMIGGILVFAGIFAWVGMYGGGRWKAMGREDIQVHEEHKRRYRWRW